MGKANESRKLRFLAFLFKKEKFCFESVEKMITFEQNIPALIKKKVRMPRRASV